MKAQNNYHLGSNSPSSHSALPQMDVEAPNEHDMTISISPNAFVLPANPETPPIPTIPTFIRVLLYICIFLVLFHLPYIGLVHRVLGHLLYTLPISILIFIEITCLCIFLTVNRFSFAGRCALVVVCLVLCAAEVLFFVLKLKLSILFVEPDGYISTDWRWAISAGIFYAVIGMALAVTLFIIIISTCIPYELMIRCSSLTSYCGRICKLDRIKMRVDDIFIRRVPDSIRKRRIIIRWTPCMCCGLAHFGLVLACVINLLWIYTTNIPDDTEKYYTDCDDLDELMCVLPYPSYKFMTEAETPTGYRVYFGSKALPVLRSRRNLDPGPQNEFDGFSVATPCLTHVPGLSLQHTLHPSYNTVSVSLWDNSSTIIIDAETRVRVPHFIELDELDDDDPDQKLLILQPAETLLHGRRYIIILRNMRNERNEKIPPNKAFQSLLDGTYRNQSRQAFYDRTVLSAIDLIGINRTDVFLAWNFVTASRVSLLGRAKAIRQSTFRVPLESMPLAVSKIESEQCVLDTSVEGKEYRGRVVWGYFNSPNFLVDPDRRGSLLMTSPLANTVSGLRDERINKETRQLKFGAYHGWRRVGVVIYIPCSVILSGTAAKVMQYGHGLFGSRKEALEEAVTDIAELGKYVVVAVDWYGMSQYDLLTVFSVLASHPEMFMLVPEGSQQGFTHALSAARGIHFWLKIYPSLFTTQDMPIQVANSTVFYGVSQGAILGGGYFGFNDAMPSAVLGSGGSPFAFVIPRSAEFKVYERILRFSFQRWRHIRFALSLFQTLWDVGESAAWIQDLRDASATRRVLAQAADGDASVSAISAQILCRSLKCSGMGYNYTIDGVPTLTTPNTTRGNILSMWTSTQVMNSKQPTDNHPAPEETTTHFCLRRQDAAKKQIVLFLSNGTIANTCPNGICIATDC